MSEDNQIKMVKKIKIKKPISKPQTIDIEDVSDITGENLVNNLLGDDFNGSQNSSFSTPDDNDGDDDYDVNDDHEFDQLLKDFIFSSNSDGDDEVDITDLNAVIAKAKKEEEEKTNLRNDNDFLDVLREQERNLFDAYINFTTAIKAIASQHNIKLPKFAVNAKVLYPKYKPRMGREIASDSLLGWDVMLKAHPARLSSIDPTATDEELLDFAERTTDEDLQLAIISYVEILIEIEGCEIEYEKRRLKAKRRRIEKEIYMEHQKRAERAQRYINTIKEKKFPIDAERLVKNFLKTSKKDAENAFKALTTNPAVFAPIDFSKMKARFFGMIKVTPQDGIKMNKKIGNFLKNLRV